MGTVRIIVIEATDVLDCTVNSILKTVSELLDEDPAPPAQELPATPAAAIPCSAPATPPRGKRGRPVGEHEPLVARRRKGPMNRVFYTCDDRPDVPPMTATQAATLAGVSASALRMAVDKGHRCKGLTFRRAEAKPSPSADPTDDEP